MQGLRHLHTGDQVSPRCLCSRRLGAAWSIIAIIMVGCGSEPADVPLMTTIASRELATGETVSVWWRGAYRQAVWNGRVFVVEGDIAIGGPEVLEATAVRIQGLTFAWPEGTIQYAWGPGIAGTGIVEITAQNDIEAALQDWQDAVPGISFVRVANNSASGDFIRFVDDSSNTSWSYIGRIGGGQNLQLAPWARATFSLHHEVGHAMGLYHQHTRKDRDSHVQINWGEIRGCPPGATSHTNCSTCTATNAIANCGCTAASITAGTCDFFNAAPNFGSDNNRADLGAYDFDSVMHYRARDWSKTGNATITVLDVDPTTGSPYVIGQKTHLSEGDVAGVRAMYPVLEVRPQVLFFDTGPQRLCILRGREHDSGTAFEFLGTNWPRTNDVADTTGLLPGDYNVQCRAGSNFWSSNYDYPSTTAVPPASTSVAESHQSAVRGVRVLNPGLIAALFEVR